VPDEDKDYKLKVLQAWADLKFKVATLVLAANGAALATAISFVKDHGPKSEGLFPVKVAAVGLLFGAIALRIVWSFSDSFLTIAFEGEPKLAIPVKTKKTKEPPKWLAKWFANFNSMRFANRWFEIFAICSALCLVLSVGYLVGFVEAAIEFISKHPGAEKILDKW
jgi:hypothetical protein